MNQKQADTLMKAMVLIQPGKPLQLQQVPKPKPDQNQILIQVAACAVCRTDLHIFDGELPPPKLPLILGHQIVGKVLERGDHVKNFSVGDRVGVPWLQETCGTCPYCLIGRENLCEQARFTGYDFDGGFAEYCVAHASYCFPIPDTYNDIEATPLLCGGLIGYRALRLTQPAKKIGFYGFGSSAHLLTQVVTFLGGEVYAFTRKDDREKQEFAKKIGAIWAGDSDQLPPLLLDGAIVFAPVGDLLVQALKVIKKGAHVVSAEIHMSPIPSFPYHLIWGEKVLTTVANLTRKDGEELLALAPKIPIQTVVTVYPLEKVNQAFEDLRHGRFFGTAVIVI